MDPEVGAGGGPATGAARTGAGGLDVAACADAGAGAGAGVEAPAGRTGGAWGLEIAG